jgi:murein L,D-transpeptidase YafK
MTEAQFASLGSGLWHGFWRDLKRSYDLFEVSHTTSKVSLCAKLYAAAMGDHGSLGSELGENCAGTREPHS